MEIQGHDMKWQKKLNETDHRHLKATGSNTLAEFKHNLEFQVNNEFPCWKCVTIGRKLGLEVTLREFYTKGKHFSK